jgi:hypothetical protein
LIFDVLHVNKINSHKDDAKRQEHKKNDMAEEYIFPGRLDFVISFESDHHGLHEDKEFGDHLGFVVHVFEGEEGFDKD